MQRKTIDGVASNPKTLAKMAKFVGKRGRPLLSAANSIIVKATPVTAKREKDDEKKKENAKKLAKSAMHGRKVTKRGNLL